MKAYLSLLLPLLARASDMEMVDNTTLLSNTSASFFHVGPCGYGACASKKASSQPLSFAGNTSVPHGKRKF